ncbi:hypothetical protein ACP4OV_019931 [Aristida adscensionis]
MSDPRRRIPGPATPRRAPATPSCSRRGSERQKESDAPGLQSTRAFRELSASPRWPVGAPPASRSQALSLRALYPLIDASRARTRQFIGFFGSQVGNKHKSRNLQHRLPEQPRGSYHCQEIFSGVKMEGNLPCRRKRQKRCHNRPSFEQQSAKAQFSDLPQDVLGTILSKLPQKEVVRISALSYRWKHTWTVCPKLRFDGAAMRSGDLKPCSHQFVGDVDQVLKEYHGKVIEQLEVKFEFDKILAQHLDSWIKSALSSRAKSLALDLLPVKWGLRPDRYRFPFELFDDESMSRLQRVQLSFVSLRPPPSKFIGFPNLKKLDLHVLNVTRKDLQDMLSNSCNLEWLSIVRCHLGDELRVVRPLPRLLYLHVARCEISKIEFSAINLQTFVYEGMAVPIYLGHPAELKDATVNFSRRITLQFALTALPNLLPSVRSLILHPVTMVLEVPTLLENSSKFSQLKYLQMRFSVAMDDSTNILSLASFLSAAPLLEKLEIHFSICALPEFADVIRTLPHCRHNHLKNLVITGFAGCTGQVELLVHIVENAPNLYILTIDRVNNILGEEEYERRSRLKAIDIARKHLDGRTSQNTKVFIM